MSASFSIPDNTMIDLKAVPVEAISLEGSFPFTASSEPDLIQQAIQLSSLVTGESEQWQTYLNALSLFGFEVWLREHLPEVLVDRENCSIFSPQTASFISAVANLQVGEFWLCLLTIGSLGEEEVLLPRAVIDLPEFMAHFYVVIEVLEETELVQIRAFLTHDQLVAYQQSGDLHSQPGWRYELPLAAFNSNTAHLLLYLRCLAPATISLPEIATDRCALLTRHVPELIHLAAQLETDEPLWRVLTWEQAEVVLTNQELLQGLYRLRRREPLAGAQWKNLVQSLAHTLNEWVINTAVWLQNRLDQVAQSLAWKLLPPLMPSTVGLRSLRDTSKQSPVDEFQTILAEIRQTNLEIPVPIQGAYQNFLLAEIPLRLYAASWPVNTLGNPPEWSLLLVVAPVDQLQLPQGLKLEVRDGDTLLVEHILPNNTDGTYLYACVAGHWEERFSIKLSLFSGEALLFPPFSFVMADNGSCI